MNNALSAPGTRSTRRTSNLLWKKAYDAISRMIQERELPAGAPVVELQLVERLGLSRTPLRQALQRLEVEGLLVKSINHSFIVRKVDLAEYLQSLRVRELLEGEAAALSAGRVATDQIEAARRNVHAVRDRRPYDMLLHWKSDDEVHGLFIKACGNQILAAMIRQLRTTTNLFEIERLSERLDPDSRQHERILDSLAADDADAARQAVTDHIQSLFEFAVRTIGQ